MSLTRVDFNNNTYVLIEEEYEEVLNKLRNNCLVLLPKLDLVNNYELQTINIGEKTKPYYYKNITKIVVNPSLITRIQKVENCEPIHPDKHVHVIKPGVSINSFINEIPEGDTILFTAGVYNEKISLTKQINICANKKSDGTYEEVIFNSPIDINLSEGKVNIEHISFEDILSEEGTGATKKTAKGNGISINGNPDVVIKDVVFKNFNNFYNNILINSSNPVVIENCEFKEGNSYHIIEYGLNVRVPNGTIIRNNKFGKVCTQNCISMYDYEENATITIEGNEFAYSANCLRFSNVNNKHVTLNVKDNVYFETDNTPASGSQVSSTTYAGLSIFQDYTGTQDFSLMTVNYIQNYFAPEGKEKTLISADTFNTEAQAYYVYVDKDGWNITEPIATFA